MHISITGKLGSGKSTICRILQNQYGYEIFSTGVMLRRIAEEQHVDLLELNKRLNDDPTHAIDNMIDEATTRISRERKNDRLIFDSRMAWYFAEDTFKVFVTIDPMVAAERVFADPRGQVEQYASIEEACRKLTERSRTEQARFIAFYGQDYYDYRNYNLVVDSSHRTPEEIVRMLWTSFEDYRASQNAEWHREYL